MEDLKIREAINQYAIEHDIEPVLLDRPYFDHSIIGITSSGHIVYDFSKMVEEFAEDEECEEIEAIEFLEYNTLRAVPYMGDYKPIILQDNITTILELYGDGDPGYECSSCSVENEDLKNE